MHRRASSDANMPGNATRTSSVSSDRPILSGLLIPGSANPPPSYVALAAASQIVTDHHDAKLQDELKEEVPHATSIEGALFSAEALALLNAFLDYLLYSFLSSARSTSLVNLRPAIFEVLRPRLAREAVGNADEELQELLSSTDEEEELSALQNGQDPETDWNLDLAWKRARLRVMVYIRLGEMEDEDEERFLREDEMNNDNNTNGRFPGAAGLVSWAAAIFLTSVVEYVAEQTLIAAGQAAYDRIEKKKRQTRGEGADDSARSEARVVIEESDMEKVALSPALGRLWRTWRKRLRAPFTPTRSGFNYVYSSRRTVSAPSITGRRSSTGTVDDAAHSMGDSRRQSTQTQVPESELSALFIASNIPLPMAENDVNEIEVPGLAEQSDDEISNTETPIAILPSRPWSEVIINLDKVMLDQAKKHDKLHKISIRGHDRCRSLPNLYALPSVSPTINLLERITNLKSISIQRAKSPANNSQGAEDTAAKSNIENISESETKAVNDDDKKATALITKQLQKRAHNPGELSTSGNAASGLINQRVKSMALHASPKRSNTSSSTHSTNSSHKSSPKSFTTATHDNRLPIMHPEESSHREDTSSTDMEDDDPAAIGIARTSNISIPASPLVTPSGRVHSKVTLITTTRGVDRTSVETQPQQYPIRKERNSNRIVVGGDEAHLTDSNSPNQAQLSDQHPLAPSRTSPAVKSKSMGRTPEFVEKDHNTQRATPFQSKPGEPMSRQQNSKTAEVAVNDSPVNHQPKGQNSMAHSRFPDRANVLPVAKPLSEPGHVIQGSEAELERLRRMSSVKQSIEEKRRDFEELVQSDGTVKYTLTPRNIRQLESTALTPSASEKPTAQTTKVTVYPPAISGGSLNTQVPPSKALGNSSISRSASSTGRLGKSSQNEEIPNKEVPPPRPNASRPVKTGTSEPSRSLPTLESSSTRSGRLAREPRINTESTRDFADFIRSTGPNKEPGPRLPFVSPKDTGTNGKKGLNAGRLKGSSRSNSTRRHMEPRNAAVTPANDTSELIDFIRRGPPNSVNGQQPRIPRSVAPFRTTMDSDDFGALGERESEISLNQSLGRTSVNSRTGLLSSVSAQQTGNMPNNNVQRTVAPKANASNVTSVSSSVPDLEPVRKRYRVKDPYSIESDDDDDNLLTALPHHKARKEETMLDFLKAMEGESESRSARTGGTTATAATASSASRTATQTATNRSAASPRSGGSRATPNTTTTASKARYEIRSAGRIPTVRDARAYERSATSDLADFLRNSGPPEPKMATPAPLVNARMTNGKDAKESKSGIKFWKRL